MIGMSEVTIGLVFSAAGTSFPDFLASLIVAHKGEVDMAISNAFGSNIFDFLLGLGFPWFLQLCVLTPGETLYVGDPKNDGVTEIMESMVLLTVTLFIWLVCCAAFRWCGTPQHVL